MLNNTVHICGKQSGARVGLVNIYLDREYSFPDNRYHNIIMPAIWVLGLLGFLGKNSRIRPNYNEWNYVVVGRAAVIPFNII